MVRYKTYCWVRICSQLDHTHRNLVGHGDDERGLSPKLGMSNRPQRHSPMVKQAIPFFPPLQMFVALTGTEIFIHIPGNSYSLAVSSDQ